jgi:peptide methionine sulfoxide reductase msrA/msrB
MYLILTFLAVLLVGMGCVTPVMAAAQRQVAIFGGGCFWCMEPPFEEREGVIEVTAGYAGGSRETADYQQVSSGRTDHYEAVRVVYDPAKVTYGQLLEVFWRQIDPTDGGGQFGDRGFQYKTAIFYRDEVQRELAEKSKAELAASGLFSGPIATRILPAAPFYEAEEYHQDYYRKNYSQYAAYKEGSGRKAFLEKMWPENGDQQKKQYGKPADAELRRPFITNTGIIKSRESMWMWSPVSRFSAPGTSLIRGPAGPVLQGPLQIKTWSRKRIVVFLRS